MEGVVRPAHGFSPVSIMIAPLMLMIIAEGDNCMNENCVRLLYKKKIDKLWLEKIAGFPTEPHKMIVALMLMITCIETPVIFIMIEMTILKPVLHLRLDIFCNEHEVRYAITIAIASAIIIAIAMLCKIFQPQPSPPLSPTLHIGQMSCFPVKSW